MKLDQSRLVATKGLEAAAVKPGVPTTGLNSARLLSTHGLSAAAVKPGTPVAF